jgi:hypothetical protein
VPGTCRRPSELVGRGTEFSDPPVTVLGAAGYNEHVMALEQRSVALRISTGRRDEQHHFRWLHRP